MKDKCIKKDRTKLANGKIINGFKVKFSHIGKSYTWKTISLKEARKFAKQMGGCK